MEHCRMLLLHSNSIQIKLYFIFTAHNHKLQSILAFVENKRGQREENLFNLAHSQHSSRLFRLIPCPGTLISFIFLLNLYKKMGLIQYWVFFRHILSCISIKNVLTLTQKKRRVLGGHFLIRGKKGRCSSTPGPCVCTCLLFRALVECAVQCLSQRDFNTHRTGTKLTCYYTAA